MPLREELEASGRWLFRWRSYLPVAFAVPVLLGMNDFRYPGGSRRLYLLWGLGCLAVSLFGLAIRCYTIAHTPQGTSGRNTRRQVAESLNTTGLYSAVRHPLYLGNLFMWLGVALFPRSAWTVAVVALVFWLYYERIMLAEEEFLRRSFGEAYERWAGRTPAFIPDFAGWTPPDLPFSLRTVLKREYSGLFGVVASFTLLDLVAQTEMRGEPAVDPLWLGTFAAGLALYLTLRLLKRRTHLLQVPGR